MTRRKKEKIELLLLYRSVLLKLKLYQMNKQKERVKDESFIK